MSSCYTEDEETRPSWICMTPQCKRFAIPDCECWLCPDCKKKLDRRIASLEALLDKHIPGWREQELT